MLSRKAAVSDGRGKASGSDMARAEQKDLKAKNYYKGKIDGYIGKQHVIAKQKFLRDKGFYKGKIDGYYGVETCKADQRWMELFIRTKPLSSWIAASFIYD